MSEDSVQNKPKVYIYCAGKMGGFGDDYVMVAISETADWHMSHVCSHPSYARWDLHDAGFRHKYYEERFGGWGDGEFYDLVIVDKTDDIPLETLVAAGIRNADGSRVSS